jgi:hypothetical protein
MIVLKILGWLLAIGVVTYCVGFALLWVIFKRGR